MSVDRILALVSGLAALLSVNLSDKWGVIPQYPNVFEMNQIVHLKTEPFALSIKANNLVKPYRVIYFGSKSRTVHDSRDEADADDIRAWFDAGLKCVPVDVHFSRKHGCVLREDGVTMPGLLRQFCTQGFHYRFSISASRDIWANNRQRANSGSFPRIGNSRLAANIESASVVGKIAGGIRLNREPWTFSQLQLYSGNVGRIPSSVGGYGRLFQSVAHVSSEFKKCLLVPFQGLPLLVREKREYAREDGYESCIRKRPPIGRRFALAWITGFLLIPASYYSDAINNGAFRRVVLWGAFVSFWCSLVLIFLCGFSWSWGWWL